MATRLANLNQPRSREFLDNLSHLHDLTTVVKYSIL